MIDPRERFSDAEEVFRVFGDALKAGMWGALPGIVNSINWDEMTVSVKPSIMAQLTASDGATNNVELPLLPDVPICFMCGGGGVLTMPITAGDEALVVFSSLCIDGWWQLGGVQPQTELRLHDLSDGFAIIGPRSQAKKITNISTTTVQLRSIDGTTYYELVPSTQKINIVAPGGINANGVLIDASGNISSSGTIINNGKHVDSTHTHTSETRGTPTSPPL